MPFLWSSSSFLCPLPSLSSAYLPSSFSSLFPFKFSSIPLGFFNFLVVPLPLLSFPLLFSPLSYFPFSPLLPPSPSSWVTVLHSPLCSSFFIFYTLSFLLRSLHFLPPDDVLSPSTPVFPFLSHLSPVLTYPAASPPSTSSPPGYHPTSIPHLGFFLPCSNYTLLLVIFLHNISYIFVYNVCIFIYLIMYVYISIHQAICMFSSICCLNAISLDLYGSDFLCISTFSPY